MAGEEDTGEEPLDSIEMTTPRSSLCTSEQDAQTVRSSGTSQITWSLNEYTSRCVNVWRPWSDGPKAQVSAHAISSNQMKLFNAHQGHFNGKVMPSGFQHPVKLFWPKSRYYDFLYQDAEKLLQNFPVQATISLYQETDGSSSSEEDDFCND